MIDYFLDNPKEKEKCEKLYLKNSHIFNQDECMKRMEDMMQDVIKKKKKEKKQNKKAE